ncbi:S8 family serine peptidase [Shewanella cyperi]|uniref:S8 family serine peptidase n=1 Tax=Shewanella cyperi TaxID=2814292 RepID=UPI001A95095D|nr:S8 family serine peptidase [Shewanella cyperi]QSX41229.1 S8 family serine peptidase [Shewanella cyperi]
MRKPHIRLSRLTLAMLSTSLMAVSAPTLAAKKLEAKDDFEPSSVIVKFKESAKKAERKQLANLLGASFKDKNDDGVDDRFRNIAKGRLAELTLPIGLDPRVVIERLKHNPHVEFAELNTRFHPSVVPNDPLYGQLWGMPMISAEKAWEMNMGTKNVVVGIIDTGFDYTHPDLRDNIWTNPNEVADNGIDDDGNGYIDDIHGISAINDNGNPMDTHYHGTHVAGTIGATGNNGIGVAGVNWNTSMIGCSFLGGQGGTTADAIQCLDYMVDMKNRGVNIRVLNNSWGGGAFSQALKDAIAAADNAGMLFVAAAGNDAVDNDVNENWPSNYDVPNVLAVASTTSTDAMSSFSQWGLNTVDMGAPGSNVYSTIPGSDYNTLSGTSMATPHVAGAAALVLAADPSLTTADVKNILMASGDPNAALEGKTVSGKRLNVESALNMAGAGGPGYYLLVSPPSRTVNQGSPTFFDIDMNAVGGYNGNATFSAEVPAGLNAVVSFSNTTVPADGMTTMTVTTDSNTALGNHVITINAVDGDITKSIDVSLLVYPAGTFSTTYSNTTQVSIPDNDANGISSIINVPMNLTLTDLVVNVDITHSYIADLLVTLTSPSGRTVTLHNHTGGSADNLVASFPLEDFDLEDAFGDWILKVADTAGQDVGTLNSWSLDVTGGSQPGTNLPPTVTLGQNLANALYLPGDAIHFVADAQDSEDGDVRASLVWISSLDGQIGTGGSFTRADLSQGSHQITVTATDSQGVTSSREFFLYVVSDGTVVSYEDTTRQPLPDMATVIAEIEVPLGVKIRDMSLFVDIQHSFANDMLIHLVSPNGTRVEIFDRKASGEYYRDLVKTFFPVEFNGEVATGIWQLVIKDEWSNNSGWLNRWELSFTHDGSGSDPVNAAPVVSISDPVGGTSFTEGDLVTFVASANDAEDGDVTNTLVWSSNLDGVIGNGANFSTTALSVGSHTVTASASDSANASGEAVVSLTVNPAPVNQLPTAEFSFTAAGLNVNFSDQSGDTDGAVVTWLWDFGDGEISSLANPSHSYATGGSYQVNLTVTDNSGDSQSVTHTVAVAAPVSLMGNGVVSGDRVVVDLAWSGSKSNLVDIYRDGQLIASTRNDGSYTDRFRSVAGNFSYQVCEQGNNACSEVVNFTPETSTKGRNKQ